MSPQPRIDKLPPAYILLLSQLPKWRNWQTRYVQGVVLFGECGFDSHLRHHLNPVLWPGFFLLSVR